MATHLDLDQQEQLDEFKALWKRYGSLALTVLALAAIVFSGLNFWRGHQRDETRKAAMLVDELELSAQAGDLEKTARVWSDLQKSYSATAYAQQAGLRVAKLQFDKGQLDSAVSSLTWVAEQGLDSEVKTMARVRLSGVLIDQKKYDDALKQLNLAVGVPFAGLVADRRGDVLMAQANTDAAKEAYLQALQSLPESLDYRVVVEAKLAALGVAPPRAAPAAGAASKPAGEGPK
jgi:predicted negative regulator of RcsB-dependent stress response